MASAEPDPTETPILSAKLTFHLLPELAEAGDTASLQGNLPLDEYKVGARSFKLQAGVSYDLGLANTGDAVLLTGSARAGAITECTRCLEEARLALDAEVEAYYLLNQGDAEVAEYDDTAVLVDYTGKVDLAIPIVASLVYETPFIVLCDEECKGLCPKCGENLNIAECDCGEELDPTHPFAALRSLFPSEAPSAANGEDAGQAGV